MIESVVLPSLSGLIMNTELLTHQFSPGKWYYSVAINHLPVSSDGLKDWYEVGWSEGWI